MKFKYTLFLFFTAHFVFGQSSNIEKLEVMAQHGEHHKVLTIADSIIDTDIDDDLRVQLLNTKLYSLYVLERWSKFKKCVDASLYLRKKIGQTEVDFAEEYLQLNWYYQAISKFDSAIYYGEKSIELTKQNYDRQRLARAYNLLGYAYSGLSDSNFKKYDIATNYYDSARHVLGEVKSAKDSLILARWYHNRGNHLINTTRVIEETITYYDSSLWIYQKFGDPSKIALNHYVRGIRHYVGDFNKVKYNFRKAIVLLTDDSKNTTFNTNLFMITITRYANIILHNYENGNVKIEELEYAYKLYFEYMMLYTKNINEMEEEDLLFFNTYSSSFYSIILYVAHKIDSVKNSDKVTEAIRKSSFYKYAFMNKERLKKVTVETVPNVELIQKSLSVNELVLDYYIGHNFCHFISKDTAGVLVLANKDVRLLVKNVNESQSLEQHTDYSKQLYNLLLKKVLREFNQVDNLIIIPDVGIQTLNFESLVMSSNGFDFKSADYLINKYNVSYQYSLGNLLDVTDNVNESNLLLINGNTGGKMTDLPFSTNLLNSINHELNSTLVNGGIRTLKNLQNVINNYEVVHIGSHADDVSVESEFRSVGSKFQNRLENYEESGIYIGDNKLKLKDISNLDLSNTDLVITQGCESGRGKFMRGEGSMSVSRSFFQAGVGSTISALWRIDDRYSSMILQDFYDQLEHHSKVEALRQAKLNFIKSAKSSEEAHPNNWAGLVYTGSDGDIKLVERTNPYHYAFLLLIFIPLFHSQVRFKFLNLFRK